MASDFRLTQKPSILAFLEIDRLYAGYAIGDLEAGLFEQCEWYGAGEAVPAAARGGRIDQGRPKCDKSQAPGAAPLAALALVFHGFTPPVLFLMGEPAALGSMLPRLSLPDLVYLNCREEHLWAAGVIYAWRALIPMWRMVLATEPAGPAPAGCVELRPADASRLGELYASGGGEAFSPAQMDHGVYFGVEAGPRIVAAAGTHLVSHSFGVAAIGNVYTHPDCRGRGYGEAVTLAVVARLRERGIRDIILNVNQSNQAAVGLYERIGFKRHCAFLEGPVRAMV